MLFFACGFLLLFIIRMMNSCVLWRHAMTILPTARYICAFLFLSFSHSNSLRYVKHIRGAFTGTAESTRIAAILFEYKYIIYSANVRLNTRNYTIWVCTIWFCFYLMRFIIGKISHNSSKIRRKKRKRKQQLTSARRYTQRTYTGIPIQQKLFAI